MHVRALYHTAQTRHIRSFCGSKFAVVIGVHYLAIMKKKDSLRTSTYLPMNAGSGATCREGKLTFFSSLSSFSFLLLREIRAAEKLDRLLEQMREV